MFGVQDGREHFELNGGDGIGQERHRLHTVFVGRDDLHGIGEDAHLAGFQPIGAEDVIGGGESVGEGVMLLVERPADEGDDGAGQVADRKGQAAPQDALGGDPALPSGTDLLGEPEGL